MHHAGAVVVLQLVVIKDHGGIKKVTTYIALFRAINVGGKQMLPMKSLCALLEGLGLHGVKSYIQSFTRVRYCFLVLSNSHAAGATEVDSLYDLSGVSNCAKLNDLNMEQQAEVISNDYSDSEKDVVPTQGKRSSI